MGKMITVEYADTSKELGDPPNGRFWTLTPDGDVHPELLSVPSATGIVCLDGRNQPNLPTNDACLPPSGASLWIWSSKANFLS